ncbi:uncharacterized protein EI90DRAFT_2971553 [Cantharellus anzutake]|uniref:uncharacterized protein n=1 Tax=Cantharellus anzutake TaxID=1750568 RepID=UPI0019053608|nr:uncharacterized protein EI90DRAFT_2971553 [Cantharellus anzutake]KAF8332748.1 hypothetical protein EI90DRAFT_2971553 [Cantharellus anzutake]
MESPHTQTQAILLERISKHAALCFEALIELNTMISQVNTANADIEVAAQLFMTYRRNVQYNLESTKSLPPPIGMLDDEGDNSE